MEPAESFPPAAEPSSGLPELAALPSLAESLRAHDFRQPAFSPAGMRKLRHWHDQFARSLAARLSIYLRLEVGLQVSKLEVVPYHEFIHALPNPTYLTLFKTEPLRGICLFDMPPRLGLTLVDRLLGGPAQSNGLPRDLSEIEGALLDQSLELILGEWCELWKNVPPLRPIILGHETSAQFLQITAHETPMLALGLETRIGDCLEQVKIAFPCCALEPLLCRIIPEIVSAPSEPLNATSAAVRWNPSLYEVQMPLTAEWQGMDITVREVTRLKPGDVLELDPQTVQQVRLRLNRTGKFLGRLGTRENRWAVEITEVLNTERTV
jgi:flagellar motor switch protein FliM